MPHRRLLHGIWILCLSIYIGSTIPQLQTAQAQSQNIGVPSYSGRDPEQHPRLTACTRFGDAYEQLGFRREKLEDWPEMYHGRVSEIIEEYLHPEAIDCSAQSYEELLQPGQKLRDLAESMPIWQDPENTVTRLDAGRVLLEYLRIYECALMEFSSFLYNETIEEEADQDDGGLLRLFLSDLMESAIGRSRMLEREREISRKALHRAISLMGTFDRLRPLEAELECMQRFTLDLRNITALTAEASACLPRMWQTKDVLRDIAPDSEQ